MRPIATGLAAGNNRSGRLRVCQAPASIFKTQSVERLHINVDTNGTVVTLTGTVRTEEERQRAARLARETEGITQVVDRLQVAK